MVYQNVPIRTTTSTDVGLRRQYGLSRRDRSDNRVAFFFFLETKRPASLMRYRFFSLSLERVWGYFYGAFVETV